MIFGHQKIRQILQNQVKNDKTHHAYLFWGLEGIGKKLVALEFAKMLLCPAGRDGNFCGCCDSCRLVAAGTHPDFQFIEPEIEETEKFSRIKEIGI
ncbi:MAG: DNA polymerase III subunit delta', partial [bacterium]|nr:DNA polymerase III subunit delta' [bacterium]